MKPAYQLARRLLLGLSISFLLPAPSAAQGAAPSSTLDPRFAVSAAASLGTRATPVQSLALHCVAAGVAPERISLLRRAAEFLETLPLEAVTDVIATPDSLELVFDFHGREVRKVTVRPQKRTVLSPRDAADPLAGGSVKRVDTEAFDLIVRNRVRLLFEQGRLKAVRAGDLRVDTWLGAFELDIRQERQPGRRATDERGRIVLALDAHGRPAREGRRFVAQESDDWLVARVKDRERWIGLPRIATATTAGGPVVAQR